MVWRTTYSYDAAGEVIAQVISEVLEARPHRSATRVAMLRDDLASAGAFAESFFRRIRFNGETALANGEAYQEVTVASDAADAAIDTAAETLAKARPTIVVVVGGTYARTESIIEQLEERLPAETPRPTYLLAFISPRHLAGFIGKSPERRARIFSVDTSPNETNNARFVIRYNQSHATHVSRDYNGGVTYDAFYLLAYGAFAAGEEPRSGPGVARAFARLVPPGHPTDVGPSSILDALTVLSSGGSIDLQGVASNLDFDLARGEETSDYRVFCAGVDARGTPTGEDVPAGVAFNARLRRVEGSLGCP
jgi:hypothetical protein